MCYVQVNPPRRGVGDREQGAKKCANGKLSIEFQRLASSRDLRDPGYDSAEQTYL